MPASVLTEDLVARLEVRLARGEFLAVACELEGCKADTVDHWLRGGAPEGVAEAPALISRLARARAAGELALLERARAVRDEGGDWKLETWTLERLRPSRYRETTRTELTGAEGGPVEVARVAAEVRARLQRLADAAEAAEAAQAVPGLPEGERGPR